MQDLEPSCQLNKTVPNLAFFKASLHLFVMKNFIVKIAVVRILHNNTKCARVFIKKRLLICYYVFITSWKVTKIASLLDRCQNSYFIESIYLFFLRKLPNFYLKLQQNLFAYLFECIFFVVTFSSNLKYLTKGSVS